MAGDGNFLSSIGLDPQLITAGSAGGLVKALIGKQKVIDSIASMVVGAIMANYSGAAVASLLSSIEVFGQRINLRPEVGGFFVGVFAYAIVAYLGTWLREKYGGGNGGQK